jgi:hypothetical protein
VSLHRGEGSLDFGWWTPGGPTAGHLLRWALLAAEGEFPGRISSVRALDLHVLEPCAPKQFAWTATSTSAGDGRDVVTLMFDQRVPFAIGSVAYRATRVSSADTGDLEPPAALPRLAYMPIRHPPGSAPPVAYRFEHRPTLDANARSPRDGWDVVWVTPVDAGSFAGRLGLASVVDAWFPPVYMSELRRYLLRLRPELLEQEPMTLNSAHVSFLADDSALAPGHSVLMASQFAASSDGHSFERFEIWNEAGLLLAIGELVRRIDPANTHASP